jgi:DNA-binding transcriptional LysR family regulator
MHVETLKIFCDLVELESFSKTAEKHLLSQSAVSQQLAQLELVHKIQLLDRKKRPMALTAAGRLFYDACKDIVDRYEQLKSELNPLQKPSAGRINVAAIYSIGMHTLPDYIKKFMVKYPDVNVHIEYLSSVQIYDLVLSGEADIGLVAVPRRDKRLEVYDFADEPLVLVCSPNHLLANEPQIDIHKVQFEKFIAFEKDTPTRGWIDSILQRYNIAVRPVMEFDNVETIKRAVEINAGISILPENTIVQEVSSRTIKAIPVSNERFVRPTGIITLKDKILGQPARYFIELLRKKV